MLSGHGLPEMPPGGSLESRLKSRIRRLLQLVDYNQTRSEQKIQERDGQNELTMTAVTGESWSLGTQRSGFSAPCPPPEIGQPTVVSRGDPVTNTFMFHGVSSPCVSPEDWFIFISGDEWFHGKSKATGYRYLILSNERGRRALILSNQMLPRPCASGDVHQSSYYLHLHPPFPCTIESRI
jgi:hypothetical protein